MKVLPKLWVWGLGWICDLKVLYCDLLFIFLTIFYRETCFSYEVQLIYFFSHMDQVLSVVSKNYFLSTNSWAFSLVFLCFRIFIILCFAFRSMIYFEMFFTKYEVCVEVYIFCIWMPNYFSTICRKDCLLSIELPLYLY